MPTASLPRPERARSATLLHLSALVGLLGNGVGFVLGPLVVWLLKRDDDVFLDEQGKEVVNFHLTMFLAAAVAGLLTVVGIGLLLLPLVLIAMVALPVVAALHARDGDFYHYPLTIHFIR